MMQKPGMGGADKYHEILTFPKAHFFLDRRHFLSFHQLAGILTNHPTSIQEVTQ